MLSFPHDYQYLIVFLQIPESSSLNNYIPSASSFFIFADGLNKPKEKKKTQTQPNKTPSAR